jgi:hypothetical protein
MMADIVVECYRFTSQLGPLLLEPPLEMNMRLEFDFNSTGSNTVRLPTFRYFE